MPKGDKESLVDKLWRTINNNKLIAGVIVFGGIVIAIAQLTGAIQTILKFTDFCNASEVNEASVDYEKMKSLFDKIHSDYENDFSQYLDYFANDGDPQKIINKLADRNNLTALDRAKLIRIVRKYVTPEDGNPMSLLNTENTYKLLMDYFGLSNTEYINSEFDKEDISVQRWRTSIKDDIENILSEKWNAFFDPGASKPPMSSGEIEKEINGRWQELKDAKEAKFELEKFKNYLILDSIRTKLPELQTLANAIVISFDELNLNKAHGQRTLTTRICNAVN